MPACRAERQLYLYLWRSKVPYRVKIRANGPYPEQRNYSLLLRSPSLNSQFRTIYFLTFTISPKWLLPCSSPPAKHLCDACPFQCTVCTVHRLSLPPLGDCIYLCLLKNTDYLTPRYSLFLAQTYGTPNLLLFCFVREYNWIRK